MTTLISTRIGRAIAVGTLVAAVGVPIAVAGSGDHIEPPWVLHYTEPGSTGYLPPSRFTIHYTEPGSTGYLPRPKFSLPYTEPGS